jgi:mono/diheme cytochrome c family protein
MARMIFLLLVLVPVLCSAHDGEKHPESGGVTTDLEMGGLLYDNWPKVAGVKTEGTHPLYPPAGKKKGKSSWRCKECHGWDYIGKDGRYGSGSHFTGFDGILHTRGKTGQKLRGVLSGAAPEHDFSPWLSPAQIRALTVFIREGLIDFREVENRLHGSAGEGGKELYGKACASCHGGDGNDIDFKDTDGVQGVGWLANDNPQETLHKIRWVHPGSDMPSAVIDLSLTDEETVAILRYARTLE